MEYVKVFVFKRHLCVNITYVPCQYVGNSQRYTYRVGWFKNPVSSQTDKLMTDTKFSDYLGLNHYKKAKKLKHFIHLRLTNRPQSFGS